MKVYIVCETGFEGIDSLEGAFLSRANAATFMQECNDSTPGWKIYNIHEVELMDGLNSIGGGTKYYAGIYHPTD